jgi:hypothetical protein
MLGHLGPPLILTRLKQSVGKNFERGFSLQPLCSLCLRGELI